MFHLIHFCLFIKTEGLVSKMVKCPVSFSSSMNIDRYNFSKWVWWMSSFLFYETNYLSLLQLGKNLCIKPHGKWKTYQFQIWCLSDFYCMSFILFSLIYSAYKKRTGSYLRIKAGATLQNMLSQCPWLPGLKVCCVLVL